VVADLTSRGIPHLAVRCTAGVGVVGPLVVPGRSACLRCCDLRRTEWEPQWPTMADQLAGHVQQAEIAAAGMAASLAAGQTLLALTQPDLAEHPPACWNALLEADAMLGALERTVCQPHPRCGCTASSGGRRPLPAQSQKGQIQPYIQVRQSSSPVDHHPRVTGSL
jgi:bacteriocin biosynthesis cyclodehydratase domain-containing protein